MFEKIINENNFKAAVKGITEMEYKRIEEETKVKQAEVNKRIDKIMPDITRNIIDAIFANI